MVAIQLCDELQIGCLPTSGAGAVELQIGLEELAALNGELLALFNFLQLDMLRGIGPILGIFLPSGLIGRHFQAIDRARFDANTAAGTIHTGNGQMIFCIGKAGGVLHFIPIGGGSGFFRREQRRTNHGVGTNEGTLVALDTLFHLPLGDVDRDTTLLPLGDIGIVGAVLASQEGADGKLVALLAAHDTDHILDIVGGILLGGIVNRIGPGVRNCDLVDLTQAQINRSLVLVHNVLALIAISHFDGVLQFPDRGIQIHDAGNFEKGCLGDHVDAVTQTEIMGNIHRIDGVQAGLAGPEGTTHTGRELRIQLFVGPIAVQQKTAALFQIPCHVIFLHIGLVVAGDEIRALDLVGALDKLGAHTEVGDGQAAGFFRVIGKIGLHIIVRVVAHDFDGGLVRADGAVGAESPEFQAEVFLGRGIEFHRISRQGQIGDVIHDTHCKVVLGRLTFQVCIDRHDICGRKVLGGQAKPAADDHRRLCHCADCVLHIHVKRFADRAGLFRSVQHSDTPHPGRKRLEQEFDGEGTEQMHLDQAETLAAGIPVLQRFADHTAGRAHGDDHIFRLGVAEVIKGMVVRPAALIDHIHVLFHRGGNLIEEAVGGLTILEENIRIRYDAPGHRMVGIEGVPAERLHRVPVQHLGQILIVQDFDFLVFVGGTETVEEMQDRHAGADCGQMGGQRHVIGLLHTGGGQHRYAGLTAAHDILLITEDGDNVGGQRAGADMEHAGQQFAHDLVHIGQHQHQALAGSIGRGQCAALEGAVEGAGRAAFGLHFTHVHRPPKQILFSRRAPLINDLSHGGGRCDRVDGSDFREGIRCVRCCCVAIHCNF